VLVPSISGQVPFGARIARFSGGDVAITSLDIMNVTYTFRETGSGMLQVMFPRRGATYEGVAILPDNQVVLVEKRSRA